MGTRSIIGTATDAGFEGRYCHWDGYPTHHGPILQEIYRELGRDLSAVIAHVVRPGAEGYWSSLLTVAQAAEQDTKPARVPCEWCAGTGSRPADTNWDPASRWAIECGGCNACQGTGQTANHDRMDSWRSDNGDSWANQTDDWGAEWAYLLSEDGISVLCNFWSESAAASEWRRVGVVAWDDTAANWERMESCERIA